MCSSFAAAGLSGVCCTTEEAPAGSFTVLGTTLTIDLTHLRSLARRGSAARVVDTGRGINLIVVRDSHGRFAALERSCTHGGAQVVYNGRNDTVQCTSWGHSEFALDGAVLGGSARKPLRRYPVAREGTKLRIDLAGAAV
jgi:nitrite reductase/ring-hydroxylating ferredoxin subunit